MVMILGELVCFENFLLKNLVAKKIAISSLRVEKLKNNTQTVDFKEDTPIISEL